MTEYEISVTIVLRGYESISASSESDAVRKMDRILDRKFQFDLPLSQKSMTRMIRATPRSTD